MLVTIVNTCVAQTQPNNTGSRITSQDAQAVLSFHNQVRAAVGSPQLSWSAKLSAYAQQWADYLATSNNCQLKHRTPPIGEGGLSYGENIFEGSASYRPIDAANTWYKEHEKYTYAIVSQNNWYQTGHYTQMVWKKTTHVGVGVAVCKNGQLIVVANYYPAGNYMGQFPY